MQSKIAPTSFRRNTVLLFLICFFWTAAARADENDTKKAGHFSATHKLLIAAQAVVLLSALASAAASVHCQHEQPACREGNPFLPVHPSNGAIYGTKIGSTVAFIGIDRWIVHKNRYRERDPSRFAWLFWMPALSYANIVAANRNAAYSSSLGLAAARSRLIQDAPSR